MNADAVTTAEASIAAHFRRWERVRDALTISMFGLTALLGLTGEPEIAGGHPWMVLLSVLFMLWYASMYSGPYRRHIADRLARMLAYYGLGVAIWGTLIVLDGPFLMYLFVLLTTIFPQLPFGWAVGYTAGITALALWRQISLAERLADPLALVILFAAASAIGLAAAIQAVVRQSVERACLIAELEAARDALAASERHAGMLAERQRLAREIHDTLAQAFISIVTHLEAADAALIGDPTVVRRHMRQARDTARESLNEARGLVHALRPAVLEHASLPEALAQLGERWAGSTEGSVQTVITGDPYPLPAQIETTLLRAAQEALHNVRKHAGAREATLTLSYMPDTAILDVYDNGRGFDPAALEEPLRTEATEATHGYGLQAMRERVAEVGGTVSIESAPGAGTTISVAIPTACAPAQPYPERSP